MAINRCELCTKYYYAEDVMLIKYDWSNRDHPKIQSTVKECYSGIRVVCKSCIFGLIDLIQKEQYGSSNQ